MTSPTEQERTALEDLIVALAYAQSAQRIADALAAFPDVIEGAVKVLLEIGPVRSLLRLNPNTGSSAPVQAMHRQNLMRRAAYLVSAARRLTTAVRGRTLPEAISAEKRYLQAHLAAVSGRVRAATAVADTARHHEGVIGWWATLDSQTSPDCRKAHGRNFDPTRIPAIGYPGTVHPECRCKPGPPHASGLRVEDVRPDTAGSEAARGSRGAKQVIAASREPGGWTVSGILNGGIV